MDVAYLDQTIELLEKANADLKPELLTVPEARRLLALYVRAQQLAALGFDRALDEDRRRRAGG